MRDNDFEWDDVKAAANLLRHGVSFSTARRVFDDPFAFEKLDDRMTYPEDRFATIALVDGKLLSVAWTEREEGPDHLRAVRDRAGKAALS